jgi:PAS domain S-box-containing protein
LRHLSISGNPFYDPDGTFRGYRGVGRDVTAEVASREAERRATDLLGRAIERMPSPIVLWDAADRLLACNAQYRALFPGMDHLLRVGTHHREFTLTVIEDGLIQIDQPKPRAWYEERTARRRRGPNSRRLDFRTGQSFFVHDQIVEDGTLLTTFVEFGRVEALNQRIRSQEERYQAMLGAVSQAVITVDAKARIVAFNPAAEALFGYPADDVVGAKVDVLMTADQKLRPGGPLAVLRGSGRLPTNRKARRLKGLRRDGSEFPYEMIVTAWRSHDDRYMTGVIRDLTADLEMQRAMAEAQLAAEAASRAKSDFLASISHELRTPLNSILGFSQLLTTDRKTPLLDKHLRFASHIEKAGEHLLAMINQILDLAKIEAGRLEVQMEFVDIDEIVDECIELMQPVAAGRGIDLTVTPSTLGGMLFRADRTRMRQVLLNLLVVDGGPGIPEDALETIFDLFGRLDRDRRRVDGSGLGLPLSRRLVELMGGTIGVSCPPEGGAVFALDFPLVDEKRALSDLYVSQGVAR